eukprot:SAG22_NODE_205_length_15308_cov_20.539023_30_plen_390_part_00
MVAIAPNTRSDGPTHPAGDGGGRWPVNNVHARAAMMPSPPPPPPPPPPLFEVVGLDAADRRSGLGAHVRARGAIAANTELMQEHPFAAVLVDELACSSALCHHCFDDIDDIDGGTDDGTSDYSSSCCGTCFAAHWCSAACRAAAAPVHDDSVPGAKDGECATLRRLRGSFEQTRDARLLCRIQHARRAAAVAAAAPATADAAAGVAAAGGEAATGIEDLVHHELGAGSPVRAAAAASVALANSILPAALSIEPAAGLAALLRVRANSFSVLDRRGGRAGELRTRDYLSFCCASTVFLSKTVPFRAVPLDQPSGSTSPRRTTTTHACRRSASRTPATGWSSAPLRPSRRGRSSRSRTRMSRSPPRPATQSSVGFLHYLLSTVCCCLIPIG